MILQHLTDVLPQPHRAVSCCFSERWGWALACLELPVPEATVRKHMGPLSGRALGALPGRVIGREVRPPHGVC